jgi:hypothetical protein
MRVVEPYMIAYTQAGSLALSAWFLSGASESQVGQGWRNYLLESISNISVLPRNFTPPRVGYNPTGGKKYYNIQCAV